MLNNGQKEQLNEFLKGITEVLDLTSTQIKDAKSRYEAVGKWLDADNSPLRQYEPQIYPQGSFRLGTMIKPLTDNEQFDIDLVCKLNRPPDHITQHELKEMIGDRLKANADYERMLNSREGGKRCWTLEYADGTRFHLDILPALPDPFRRLVYARVLEENVFEHALRITCTQNVGYHTSTNLYTWNKSNPVGYGEWFKSMMKIVYQARREILLSAANVDKVEDWEIKTPLQRAIQLLKRHRDIMFQSDQDHKPISIIITTLAAKAYDEEEDVYDALINILMKMPDYIENRSGVSWVANPVNPEENFADKWEDNPILERNFRNWMQKARTDFAELAKKRGLLRIKQSLALCFGESLVAKSFSTSGSIAGQKAIRRELKFDKNSREIGDSGDIIPKKDFHGKA